MHVSVHVTLVTKFQPLSSHRQGDRWPQSCEREVSGEQAVGWQDTAYVW